MRNGRAVRLSAGALVAGLLALTGCSNYTVKVETGPKINNYGLPVGDQSGGRALRIAVVALDNGAFDRLADSESLRDVVGTNQDQPWKWITAKRWFQEGLGEKVRQLVPASAVWERPVSPGQTIDVKVTHPGSAGSRSGILVLADFTGMTDEGQDGMRHRFESAIWKSTRWSKHEFKVKVNETTIEWVD